VITPNSLQRREYKYLIDEETVERIRRYMRGICAVDEYAAKTGGRYLTDTLYLDTPALDSYFATMEDAPDRYKLRIRTYPSMGNGPVFFEVKRRVSESIIKTRGSYVGNWQALLERTSPEIQATVSSKNRRAIDNFICHYHYLPYLPSALVRYEREPYFSLVDDYARVTFDRSISMQRSTELTLTPEHEQWIYVDDAVSQRGLAFNTSSVLMELKFTSIVPTWMRTMIHSLDIQRLAFCKYTRSIDAMRLVPNQRVARAGFRR
jgi:hypothetical protein